MVGSTISHYTILEKLGEGGMGVVYKARDLDLDREVALKFLPSDLATSDEERSRFIHEAKAASALDHPNICTIYETGKAPDGRMFIAMGYYDGVSLHTKLEKGRLPVADAVNIAIQIVEGLQAAHEKQIVHRDIKSGNIMITGKGLVKILDFGLAHRSGFSKLTKTGSTLGTAAYMSPEQARGEAIDHRSDLWSLGVVLYEMVTGKQPFGGGHDMATLFLVVNEQPQPVEALVPDAPPELLHIIRRALEKDPAERYQTAADMLIDLRRLKKDTSRTGFAPVSGLQRRPTAKKWILLITTLLTTTLVAAGYFLYSQKTVEINSAFTTRYLQLPFNRVDGMPGISPDGKWIVFSAPDRSMKWDLYVVSAAGGEARRLTSDSLSGLGGINVSPDGNTILYVRGPGEGEDICVVPFIGGTSRKIGVGHTPKWSPDGKRIGYVEHGSSDSGPEFWTMNPDGTDPRHEFTDTLARDNAGWSFAWSPDGGLVAWERKIKAGHSEIVIHDLKTHLESPVISDTTYKNEICWTANNQIIYSSSVGDEMNLWVVTASGGTPTPLTKGMGSVDFPIVSRDGQTLLFSQSKVMGRLWVASLDGSMKREEVFSSERQFDFPDISPDGRFISFGMRMTGTVMADVGATTSQLFVMNRDGTNLRQITSGEMTCFKPRWSPDGKMISYYARGRYEPDDSLKVYVIDPFKPEAPRFVYYGSNQVWVDSVTLQVQTGGNYSQRLGRGGVWSAYLDGRPATRFSRDSIYAVSICNGQYVNWMDLRQGARIAGEPSYVCRAEEWDGVGPPSSVKLPTFTKRRAPNPNYDALYKREGFDIYRIPFHDWKWKKLDVNLQGIDTLAFFIRTTANGKEMIYKTTERIDKLGVIENLFK